MLFRSLGSTNAAVLRTSAKVDHAFAIKSFEFSLDPGSGPLTITGRLDGLRLSLDIVSASGTRTETRDLAEPPALMLSLGRRLASEGLVAGTRREWMVFDPATMKNAAVQLVIGNREVVDAGGRPTPAFRVDMTFASLTTTAWITDTGEIIREESPMGLITVRETQEQATVLVVSTGMQEDMLAASAVVPVMPRRVQITEPRDVTRLQMRVENADLSSADLQGVGQSVTGDVIELVDTRGLTATAADTDLQRYLAPEPFIESDAPEIRAEAERMVRGVTGVREIGRAHV